jgi:hypothetical protein
MAIKATRRLHRPGQRRSLARRIVRARHDALCIIRDLKRR